MNAVSRSVDIPPPRRGRRELVEDTGVRLGLHIKSAEQAMMAAKTEVNSYLLDSPNIWIKSSRKPIGSSMNLMVKGNMPLQGANLLLDKLDYQKILDQNPDAAKYMRKIVGSAEFINGKERWCIWIKDSKSRDALKIPSIAERIERVRESRLNSSDSGTQKMVSFPWRFREQHGDHVDKLVIPSVFIRAS